MPAHLQLRSLYSRSLPAGQALCLSLLVALSLGSITREGQAQTQGLSGAYYPERNFDVTPTLRVDSTIDFQWGNEGPMEDFPIDRFQVRWRGWLVAPQSAYYTLSTRSDDGVRLFVDGVAVINQWRNQAPTTYIGRRVWLDAGVTVPVTVEYFEQGGGATMELYWRREGEQTEIIPTSALRPWSESQISGQRVSASFSRPYLWEGTSTNVAQVMVARPHSDLSQPLTVELTWEGEGLSRLTGRRASVTIGANRTLTSFDVRLIDDLEAQSVEEVTIRVTGSEAPEGVLTIRDDDEVDAPESALISGEARAPGATELIVRATPLTNESMTEGAPEWVAGEPVEEFVVGDRYALSLPAGRYRVTALARYADELTALTLSEASQQALPNGATLLYDETGVVIGMELNMPPSLLSLDFEPLRDMSELEGGGRAGAEGGALGGALGGAVGGAGVEALAGEVAGEMGGQPVGGEIGGRSAGEEAGDEAGVALAGVQAGEQGGTGSGEPQVRESSGCDQGGARRSSELALLLCALLVSLRRREAL